MVSLHSSSQVRTRHTHFYGPFACTGPNVEYAARFLQRGKVVAAFEQHLEDLVLQVEAFVLILAQRVVSRDVSAAGCWASIYEPGRWGTCMLYGRQRSLPLCVCVGAGGGLVLLLTAGLVPVVGPAILADKVEDALVDRLGAPANARVGSVGTVADEWWRWGKTYVPQLSSPSEGSD
jgi:hypothetical protein